MISPAGIIPFGFILGWVMAPGVTPHLPEDQFRNFSITEGLPAMGVNALIFDRNNLMWVGTDSGLARFDGTHFEIFRLGKVGRRGFEGRVVLGLAVDQHNRLWVASAEGGLQYLSDGATNFQTLRLEPEKGKDSSVFPRSICFDGQDLWVGNDAGLFQIRETQVIAHFQGTPKPGSLSDSRVTALHADHLGRLWVGTATGLHLKSKDSVEFEWIPIGTQQTLKHPDSWVTALWLDEAENLWVGTGNSTQPIQAGGGLFQWQAKNRVWRQFPVGSESRHQLPQANVIALFGDTVGRLWVGLGGTDALGGLMLYLPESDQWQPYVHDPYRANSLGHNWVSQIAQGPDGYLWIGAGYGGICGLDLRAPIVRHFHARSPQNALLSNWLNGVAEDGQGRIWVASWEGINVFSPSLSLVESLTPNPSHPEKGPASKQVTCLMTDGSIGMWLGTWADGVSYWNAKNQTFSHTRTNPETPSGLSNNSIHQFFWGPDQSCWVVTANGLDRFNRQTQQFEPQIRNEDYGSEPWVQIAQSQTGTYWVITRSGKLEKVRLQPFEHYELGPPEGPLSSVSSIYLDEKKRLWVGTSYDGLWIYDTQGASWYRFPEKQLPHDSIWAILQDPQRYLWVSTPRGFMRIHPDTYAMDWTPVPGDLLHNLYNRNVAFRDSRNQFYFGGSHGFLALDPAQFRFSENVKPALIDRLLVAGQPLNIGPDDLHIRPIDTSYLQNDLAVTLVGPRYRNPDQRGFYYWLEPLDSDWRISRDGSLEYPGLAPGHYRLFVRLGDLSQPPLDKGPTVLEIKVAQPWWQTIQAQMAFILGILTLGWLGTRWRSRHLIHQKEALSQLVQERTQELEREKDEAVQKEKLIAQQAEALRALDRTKTDFFTQISHEFRTPLTLILGPLHDLQADFAKQLPPSIRKVIDVAEKQALRLLRLINQLLDLAKLEANGMKLIVQETDFSAFLRSICLAFDSMGSRRKIDFSMEIDPDLCLVLDRDKAEKIFFNLLSNAFKFTRDHGKIRVRAYADGTWVKVEVKDTGIGIPADHLDAIFNAFHQVPSPSTDGQMGSGVGLALTRQFVGLHKGSIRAESEAGFGCLFEVKLPSGRDWLPPDAIWAPDQPFDSAPPSSTGADFNPPELEGLPAEPDAPMVLVVDDHPEMRLYIQSCLGFHYRIGEASNATQALDQIEKQTPDLVVADVMMPGMNGFELCRTLKNQPKTQHIPVILLTARATEESKIEGLETGADDYLYKPFNRMELLARVENLIHIRRLLKASYQETVQIGPSPVSVPSTEKVFLDRLREVMDENLGRENFGVSELASAVGLSPRQLQRRIRELLQLSPSGYMRMMRLKRAAQLLELRAGSVSEIAYQVGFEDVAHFSRLFRQMYGTPPSGFAVQG